MNNQNDFKSTRHLAVDEPIINSPFKEPTHYWVYDAFTGQPAKVPGRRPAHYYFRSRRRVTAAQTSLFADEEMVPLESVNKIRAQVKKWREGGYKNAGHITRQLLRHWNDADRERKLFFCQLEAAETIIWLNEIHKSGQHGIKIPEDEALEEGFQALVRQVNLDAGRGDSIEKFIKEYAPKSENKHQDEYINFVSDKLGVSKDTKLSQLNSIDVARWVAKFESDTDIKFK